MPAADPEDRNRRIKVCYYATMLFDKIDLSGGWDMVAPPVPVGAAERGNRHSTMMKPFQLVSDSEEEGEGDTVDQQISEAEKRIAQLEWELECQEDATWEVARANNPGNRTATFSYTNVYLTITRNLLHLGDNPRTPLQKGDNCTNSRMSLK